MANQLDPNAQRVHVVEHTTAGPVNRIPFVGTCILHRAWRRVMRSPLTKCSDGVGRNRNANRMQCADCAAMRWLCG
jgi:hypothetical protein